MKALLCVGAVVLLLHLVCPVSIKCDPTGKRQLTNQEKVMKEMLENIWKVFKRANTTLPGHLLNASVPVMDYCKKNTFCEVQHILVELPDHEKLEELSRCLVAYNTHAHKNCTKHEPQNNGVTIELRDFLVKFGDCIQKESWHLFSRSHKK